MAQAPFAVFSCDLDTVDRHLQGYGVEDAAPCDRIYRTAVPRLLDLLERIGVPAVMFTIARDADSEKTLLRRMVAAGHEVASHSLTHPQPFSTLDDRSLRRELHDSRRLLTEAGGTEVIGFRAPAWDLDKRVLAEVAEAGYRYDASIFPTPAMLASRLSVYRRSQDMRAVFSMSVLGHVFSRRTPHDRKQDGRTLVEFPIAVTRWLRLPVYHTLAYLVPERMFERWLASLLRSDTPICYEFHAADLLDLAGDGIDPRMERHPGMKVPLERKLAMLESIVRRIAANRRVVTYRQALEERLAA